MTIVKRLDKGSELTHAELDGNFTDLDTRVTVIEGSSGLSNVVEDTTPQLGGALDTNGNNITFSGNTKAQFGASQDLSIFHNNNHSIIRETGTGSLYLQSDNNVILSTDSSTKIMVKGIANGATELYHNDIKKFETTADGVEVTGTLNGHTIPAGTGTLALLSDIGGGGGGSGLQSRGGVTGTTASLADAAEGDLDITGFKSYALLTITTDRAARVRLYVSAATRTADASRAEGVDPTSDAGLIAEVITTGAETVIISPGAYGFNLESSPTTTIPCRVTNKSGGTSTVQVDLNILQLEA